MLWLVETERANVNVVYFEYGFSSHLTLFLCYNPFPPMFLPSPWMCHSHSVGVRDFLNIARLCDNILCFGSDCDASLRKLFQHHRQTKNPVQSTIHRIPESNKCTTNFDFSSVTSHQSTSSSSSSICVSLIYSSRFRLTLQSVCLNV